MSDLVGLRSASDRDDGLSVAAAVAADFAPGFVELAASGAVARFGSELDVELKPLLDLEGSDWPANLEPLAPAFAGPDVDLSDSAAVDDDLNELVVCRLSPLEAPNVAGLASFGSAASPGRLVVAPGADFA